MLASREMPGAIVVPGRAGQLRRARVPRARRRRARDRRGRRGLARTSSGPGASCASRCARIAAGLRALGVERGDRVVAYMPNIPETAAAFLACASLGAVWSSCSPDFGARSVIDRFAQIEPKVLLAVDGYRYNGKDFDRSRDRARRSRDAMPGLARCAPAATSTAMRRWRTRSTAADGRRGSGVRAGAVRPPAVGPVLLGHDRPAEGDRAVPGRHPARAPEDAAPARRRAGRRPPLLVHHDRLDDVELHRLGAAHRGDDPALRRLARAPGHGRAVGLRGAHADDHVRDERLLHRRVHEGGRRARRRARPVGAEGGRLDRLAALARGLPLGLRARRRGHVAVLDERRHRPLHGVRRRRAAASRSTRASCRRARSAPRSSPGTPRASR